MSNDKARQVGNISEASEGKMSNKRSAEDKPPFELLKACGNDPLDEDEDDELISRPPSSEPQSCGNDGNFDSPYDHPDFDGEEELRRANEEARIEAIKSNTIFIGDLIASPVRKVKAYIPHIAIPGGLSMLSAEPKCGKTTLLFWALGALTTGQSFLGDECHRTKVLYASEQSSNILKRPARKVPSASS